MGEWIFWGKGTVSFSSPYPCFELLQKTFAGFFLLFIRIFEGSALVRVRDIGFFSGVFGEEMDLLIDIAAHSIEDSFWQFYLNNKTGKLEEYK